MKIALCTSDFFQPVQQVIRDRGDQVVRVFTSCPLDTGFSSKTKDFADEMQAEFTVGRVSEDDVRTLASAGVELLLAAAYDHKVPTPEVGGLKYINLHGSLLPEGRGAWPQPWILLKYPEAAGVTFHTMTQRWDHGDIVLQRSIKLSDEDGFDSLIAKTLVATCEMTRELLDNFHALWSNKRPMQGVGSYWPKPTLEQRTVNLSATVSEVQRIHRAFGQFALFVQPWDSKRFQTATLHAWREEHNHTPGSFFTASPPRLIFALKDGFVSIVPGPECLG